MLVPSKRLLQISAGILLPLAALAGFSPSLAIPCGALFTVCMLIAAADAWAGWQRVQQVEAKTPPFFRLTKDISGALPLTLQNRSGAERKVRIGLSMPEGMESEKPVLDPRLPAGSARLAWNRTGCARGDHALREVYIEAPSPARFVGARGEARGMHLSRLPGICATTPPPACS